MLAVAIAYLALAVVGAAASPAHLLSIREIRQQSIVLQQFDSSCGATALATIFRDALGAVALDGGLGANMPDGFNGC